MSEDQSPDSDRSRSDRESRSSDPLWRRFVDLVVDLTPERRREVEEELFPKGAALKSYLYRFAVLQSLAVLIALFGLLANSAAVVIGAMLVAPLMRPVLSVAATLVMGLPVRQGAAFTIVLAASAGSVVLAWAVTELLPLSETNMPGEILARTEPTLLDLGIALAAGAAGAYALVRREVSDALPGVAVAVALVPPLATVGATFALGRPDLSWGALLLYLTNLAAIVLIGAVVFILTGFVPRAQIIRAERRIRAGMFTAGVAVLAVSVPLGLHSWGEIRENRQTETSAEAVEAWTRGTKLQSTGVSVEDRQITVNVAGPKEPPPVGPLASDLAERFNTPVEVEVRWTERREISAEGRPEGG
ncbi:MAG: DUF389 domain-containing protein [Rubrobacteraceae bacterium]